MTEQSPRPIEPIPETQEATQYGIPQSLINELWSYRDPERGGSFANPLPEILRRLAAHERGIRPEQIGWNAGAWDSHRLSVPKFGTNAPYVDVEFGLTDADDVNRPEITLVVNSRDHAGQETSKAEYWNATYALRADPAWVSERLAERQAQLEETERQAEEKFLRRKDLARGIVEQLKGRVGDQVAPAEISGAQEYLTLVTDEETAQQGNFLISVSLARNHDGKPLPNTWQIHVWETASGGEPETYDLSEYDF